MSHQHDHHHHHHEHKHDFTAANKEFFDNSPNLDNPKWVEMARRLVKICICVFPTTEAFPCCIQVGEGDT